MKLWKAIVLAVGYVALQWTLVAIAAPANEYAVWAGAGITAGLMMLLGAALSLCILAVAVLKQNMRIAVPGFILVVGCKLPLYLVVGVGLLFGL
jgi:hypothetical protein